MSNENKKIGCLLIHGFTSHRSSLEAVIPELKKRGIVWHYPILAGHGTKPHDLADKTWQHWQNDVELGLQYLLPDADKIVIISLSMGSLLGLELAAKYPENIAGLVLLSPALHFKTRLAKLTPYISKIVKRIYFPRMLKYNFMELAKRDKGYLWFPTSAFKHYWLKTRNFKPILEKVHQPVLIIHAKKDKVAAPSGAQYIFDHLASQEKKLIWLEKSGHEVLLDNEVNQVLQYIFAFKLFN